MTNEQPGQPVQPVPPGQPPVPPPAGTRHTGKFVAGIILTVLGGLGLLGSLANLGMGLAVSSNAAEAAGRLVGGFLIPIVLLVVGIVLLRASKRG